MQLVSGILTIPLRGVVAGDKWRASRQKLLDAIDRGVRAVVVDTTRAVLALGCADMQGSRRELGEMSAILGVRPVAYVCSSVYEPLLQRHAFSLAAAGLYCRVFTEIGPALEWGLSGAGHVAPRRVAGEGVARSGYRVRAAAGQAQPRAL